MGAGGVHVIHRDRVRRTNKTRGEEQVIRRKEKTREQM